MMREYTWSELDKSEWGEGPWLEEPDKVQWVDEATGLDCLIVRNPDHGSLCGYVGVPPGHSRYGRDYSDLYDLEVHGGLTFAGACDEDAPEDHGICHVPEPGRPANVWWLGFDCAHAFDIAPGLEARIRELRRSHPMPNDKQLEEFLEKSYEAGYPRDTYRSIGYVRAECARLAHQLAEVRA